MKKLALTILTISLLVTPSISTAVPTNGGADKKPIAPNRTGSSCTELVRECFAYNGDERSECFYSCIHHPFCASQALRPLIEKRWALTPSRIVENQGEAEALLGHQLIDLSCVANVDNTLSSELIRGTPSNETLKSLESRLDQCRREPAMDILKPY